MKRLTLAFADSMPAWLKPAQSMIRLSVSPFSMSQFSIGLLGICFITTPAFSDDQPNVQELDYASDVRPILADACFHCHGPDEEGRKAGLRLDVADDAAAVIDHDAPDQSELLLRILEPDPDLKMPPPDSGKQLTAQQTEIIRQWLRQGATFQSHWAFSNPTRPTLPEVENKQWGRNGIDAFVLRKLELEGLHPSPTASPTTLVRRLSLDLTGLPPEPEFVRHWTGQLKTRGNDAYLELVEHLLGSQHYGEHWGRMWLDAARYADSDGYEKDKPREAWFYRDWVINSLNQDRPYDDFLIRQIAGDLLPEATQDDFVATGFLRNSMVNEEGGADPEQFRMEAMFDRMDAVGKAILGLTIQCGQCHSHKYDPLTHEEYYGLFAYLNDTHDAIIPVYTDEQQHQRDQVLQRIENIRQDAKNSIDGWQTRLDLWAKQAVVLPESTWQTLQLDFLDRTIGGSKFLLQPDGSFLCQSYAPTNFNPQGTGVYSGERITALRLELLKHPNLPKGGPGRSIEGTWALSEFTAEAILSGTPDKTIPLKFSRAAADRSPATADLKPHYDNRGKDKRVTGGIEFAIDGDSKTAWTNEVDSPQSNIPQTAWFELAEPIEIPEGQHATIIVHLAQRHGGWNSDDNQTFNIGRFRVSATSEPLPKSDPLPIAVQEVLQQPSEKWNDLQRDIVFTHWLSIEPEGNAWYQQIQAAWEDHPQSTTQLTLASRTDHRKTHLLARGDFLNPQQEVQPHVPEFLHPLQPSDEPARLQLARWLASDESPTTARSIVNRIWQRYFGTGIVETSDDLGTQGSPPTHPELLDYLATELVQQDWSLKAIHRLIVTSATYRQSSDVTEELLTQDPNNRLLARGARFRVPAETVRDITLAASGLLNDHVGGPSVHPPAPDFLFVPPVSYGPKVWNVDTDDNRYRRALYTFRFRSVPYPMLENFDAVPGNLSCVRRSVSNTPMQALTSLNEPLFMECSIALAAKLLRQVNDASNVDATRIQTAALRCLGRAPSEHEQTLLTEFLQQQRERVDAEQLSADDILTAGKLLDLEGLDRNELATWTLLCRVILNLDETITRE
ncbi:PSD1 and planctomycete cytochrome C domain-containing protein [Stieleria sp. JC731]|uniref:PSD1 and planctomycete cytochrome C domain-containing protein n=1 Tax=Pirellulaceae TaxID=2691357 RepID=UPI001E53FC56|nr:PSD1 and planctomycete cytochrome C domain-containing protein [Stieleria sp. JC731]MCC9602367.1 PSD1 and planctomycete cytochrome C domain-containing protein [Stieleria sp. JC731]